MNCYAVYNKNLFASQARFLDAPVRIQQNMSVRFWHGWE